MAKVLQTFDLPDMRRKYTSSQLATEIFNRNKERIMEKYNRVIGIAFGPVPSPVEMLSAEIERQMTKDPKLTQKEAAIKALNTRAFSTKEEVYARNTITMLKKSKKYDELRKLAGWNKGIKLEEFELDPTIGYMVYAGEWVIYHDEDYYTEDGLQILSIEDYTALYW